MINIDKSKTKLRDALSGLGRNLINNIYMGRLGLAEKNCLISNIFITNLLVRLAFSVFINSKNWLL